LKQVIDLSNRHLSQEARCALRRLAVFLPKPNTFQEDAALAVCATPAHILDELIDAGLVESQGQGYYTLHQIIADYAKTVNDISQAARDAAKERMIAFFVSFTEIHSQQYALLEGEARNIATALDFACEQENFSAFLNGVNAFADFWLVRSQHSTAEKYLYRAYDIAESIGDVRSLALTSVHLALIAELHGELNHANTLYESGLEAARRSENDEVVCILLTRWSALMVHRSESIRAKPLLVEGMKLASSLQNKSLMARLFKSLGEVVYVHGQYQQMTAYYEEGLRLARACEDNEIISALLQNMGAYAVHQRNYQLAHQRFTEGLSHARSIKHQERISALLMNQGFLAIQEQNYALAKKLSIECLEIAYENKSRFRMAVVLQNLGIIETRQEHYVRATQYFNASYEIACNIEHVWVANETLCEWGELHLKRGERSFASDKFVRALKAARAIEAPELAAIALFGLARVAGERGEYEQAKRWGQESFALYERMGDPRSGEVSGWLQAITI
jgi:tetratricopeptide (TPR) repeat protein